MRYGPIYDAWGVIPGVVAGCSCNTLDIVLQQLHVIVDGTE